ncbi:FUN14 domain-containing protein 1 [Drosophila albomicans]|uniref:FUN14 domain-containing protein 1 n=1 Tax=Drosophila albomicans TaxID=7291 RepID=A0A6P8WMZ3_DROAB|nr:FUN14 domain-containing protein 1 [Drosophila albomicans]
MEHSIQIAKVRTSNSDSEMADNQVIKLNSCLGKQSPYVQIVVGAGSGFVAGYVFFKVFKVASIITGTTILAVELCIQTGIITINWRSSVYLRSLQEEEQSQLPERPRIPDRTPQPEQRFLTPFSNIRKAIMNSARLSFAFLGGFFIGMGVS